MGFLRLYLALCIVAIHSNSIFPWQCHNGREAVQIFYLISGFYMAHIANKYSSVIEFYASRFFRIFTPYYAVFVIVLTVNIISGLAFDSWGQLGGYVSRTQNNGTAGIIAVAISNITLFFQDWVMFLKHDSGETLSFTLNFWESKSPLYIYLIIPQAWTVGVELTFYLFVPFLNKQKNKILLGILFTSLLARIIAYEYFGLKNSPFTYRFFPFEIAIFILGILSNRLYLYICNKPKFLTIPKIKTTSQYLIATCMLIVFFWLTTKAAGVAFLFTGSPYNELLSYCGWFLVIPILFHIFSPCRYDRFIGNLSYPVYLSHIFVIYYLKVLLDKFGISAAYLGEISAVVTIIISIVLYKCVISPVDKRRYALSAMIANKISRPLH